MSMRNVWKTFAASRFIAAVCVCVVLVVASCGKKEDKWTGAQQQAEQMAKAKEQAKDDGTAPVVQEGGGFNTFFPPAQGGFERVASQEKEGFSEYKLKKDGKDVAMLAINDLAANPAAAEKFKKSTKMIGGFPAVDQGSTATAVLVAGKYQVKVLSRDPAFSKADREAWLAKFNLSGLAAMK